VLVVRSCSPASSFHWISSWRPTWAVFNSRGERAGREQLAGNVGVVYRLTRSLAVDAGVQASLLGRGPDDVVRTGLSVLWR